MLKIHKKVVLDENQHPFAVQIPIDEFERLEEIIENHGLSKLMDEVNEDERLTVENAKTHYRILKKNVEN
jgi:PHD/YefM family antitoxin component YafN of YafNO toxin-antitoxin module